MTMQRRKLLLFALLAALFAASVPSGTASAEGDGPNANEIVDKVQSFYAGVDDFEAEFVQTTAHKLFSGRLERSYGRVLFKKGGLMRWEYTRPDKKLFIYDGTTLWIYEPEVPQVFKGTADAEKLRRALAFLTGEGKIKDEYNAKKVNSAKYGFAEGHVLKCVPKKKNSPFKYVELYIDKTSFRVVRSVLVDAEGNRNRLDLAKPKTNSNLSPGLFSFTPPKGVPVLSAQQ